MRREGPSGGAARACGAEIRLANTFDEDALCVALADCDLGINVATSLPGPSGRGDFTLCAATVPLGQVNMVTRR